MSSLKELTYRLWRHLEGGNIPDDSRFTYSELIGYIRGGVSAALKTNYFEHLNLDDYKYGDDGISATYTVSVVHNDDKHGGLPYATLPAKPISLPGNRGVSISDKNRVSVWSNVYVPIRQEEVLVGRLQPTIPCVIQYYRTGTDLVFFNNEVKLGELSVTVRYGLPQSDEEELSMPEEFHNSVLTEAIRICNAEIRPIDNVNDGAVPQIR